VRPETKPAAGNRRAKRAMKSGFDCSSRFAIRIQLSDCLKHEAANTNTRHDRRADFCSCKTAARDGRNADFAGAKILAAFPPSLAVEARFLVPCCGARGKKQVRWTKSYPLQPAQQASGNSFIDFLNIEIKSYRAGEEASIKPAINIKWHAPFMAISPVKLLNCPRFMWG
jgi:hypothetical protein